MELSRRNILSILGTAPLLGAPALALASPRRGTKISFLTDIHLPASNEINSRAIKAFKLANKSDMILLGGDNLMAIDHQPENIIQAQFENWQRLASHHLGRPYRTVLGNHDIEMIVSPKPTNMCGKERSSELFGMKGRYWTDKVNGWRIVGLDTVQHRRNTYVGHVDHEQRKWLRDVLLADRTTPTLVVGHMPILSVTMLADRTTHCGPNSLPISFCSQVGNSREVVEIFREAGNVRLCLSGHTHMNDRCEFAGTTYVCGGSVSGSWWKGPHQGFAPSFTDVTLHNDGSFDTKTIHWES